MAVAGYPRGRIPTVPGSMLGSRPLVGCARCTHWHALPGDPPRGGPKSLRSPALGQGTLCLGVGVRTPGTLSRQFFLGCTFFLLFLVSG